MSFYAAHEGLFGVLQVDDAQEQNAEVADIIDGRHALGSHLLLSYNAQASRCHTPSSCPLVRQSDVTITFCWSVSIVCLLF